MKDRIDFLDELRWRGLIHQVTHEEELRLHLADPAGHRRRGYVGFDPTSDSLTIGNLVPMMLLVHFRRAGHEPVVVMGGGTGLIGDPSGKSAERILMTEEQVAENVEAQRGIFERVFANAAEVEGGAGELPVIFNNLDWLGNLGYIEVLRDIGKHFSVNMMIQKDSVRDRLHAREHGISYTEFSYMILQAYDYLHLFKEHDVTVQMGGSDQWGNILEGRDLIRRFAWIDRDFAKEEKHVPGFITRESRTAIHARQGASIDRLAFGLTAPLVTKSDGTKFGKTESGAIWLSAERTSPYAYYQFWLNAADADVGRYLRIFTLLSREEIEAIDGRRAANPGAREAQRVLAREATRLLHGRGGLRDAEAATQALFSGDVGSLSEAVLREVLADVPTSSHDKSLLAGEGVSLVDLLPLTSLATSKREAREFLTAGAVSVCGRKVSVDARLTSADLLHGAFIPLRRGKKHWHLTVWG